MKLNNQVAIIVGGASGIGEATCRLFAQQGAQVVVADINANGAQRVADQHSSAGGKAAAIAAEAKEVQFDPDALHVTHSADETVAVLRTLLRPDDLVLVKGSRAVGMESIIGEIITTDPPEQGQSSNSGQITRAEAS